MAQQFTNNARALLTSSIALDATSIVIESVKADLFPVTNVGANSLPSVNDWFFSNPAGLQWQRIS